MLVIHISFFLNLDSTSYFDIHKKHQIFCLFFPTETENSSLKSFKIFQSKIIVFFYENLGNTSKIFSLNANICEVKITNFFCLIVPFFISYIYCCRLVLFNMELMMINLMKFC